MNCDAVHSITRWLVVAVLVISAWPTINSATNPHHLDTARALLAGSIWIETPTTLHDVGEVDGAFYTPFPPLPALLAVPAILTPWPDAVFNSLIVVAAALAVVLAGGLGDRRGGRATGTWAAVALGLGSGLWAATAIHDTYHSAHVLAVLAVVAALNSFTKRPRRTWIAGFLLGIGALARQTVALAAIPMALAAAARKRGSNRRRAVTAVLVATAFPVVLYLGLNTARFGSPIETGYSGVRHHPRIAADVEQHGVFSATYIPRNLKVMLSGHPIVVEVPPFIVPDPTGMSILLVSPWLVFALLPLFRPDRPSARRLALCCWIGALAISVPHLLYVNSGWVQFGFRFALDWMPFLLLAAILGVRRLSARIAGPVLAVAVVINCWGLIALATWESWSALLP